MGEYEDADEEFVAQLVAPDDYSRHRNQVASLTTKYVKYVRRKVLSKDGYEVVLFPMSQCLGIEHRQERSALSAIVGLFVLAMIASIIYLVALAWDDLDSGTMMPIGALVVAAAYGIRLAAGSRRHRLLFNMKDGATLIWKSRSGDFKYFLVVVQRVLDFAGRTGLLCSSLPTARSLPSGPSKQDLP